MNLRSTKTLIAGLTALAVSLLVAAALTAPAIARTRSCPTMVTGGGASHLKATNTSCSEAYRLLERTGCWSVSGNCAVNGHRYRCRTRGREIGRTTCRSSGGRRISWIVSA